MKKSFLVVVKSPTVVKEGFWYQYIYQAQCVTVMCSSGSNACLPVLLLYGAMWSKHKEMCVALSYAHMRVIQK